MLCASATISTWELWAKSKSRSACAICCNKPTQGATQHQQPISSRPTRSSSPLSCLAEHSLTLTSTSGSLVASYRTNLQVASRLRKNVWNFSSKPAKCYFLCSRDHSHFHFRTKTPRHRDKCHHVPIHIHRSPSCSAPVSYPRQHHGSTARLVPLPGIHLYFHSY